ncbi:MAG TPA: HAMP domain-containing sensor histidine kinase [Myxococcaceae bacterium]|nr:HAMP domain-containing sensor histidine kinase [Myxococcaceae bacterium]
MPPPGDSMVVLRLIPKEGAQSPFALLNQKISDLVREVLNRKRAEEQALSALRAREEFLAVASHEFKTPLQSVKLQLDLIERTSRSLDAFSLKRLMPRIELMRRQVERLTTLSNGLLDLTAIKAGRMPLRLEDADVTDVVRLTVGRMEDQFQKVGCAIRLDLHPLATAVVDVSKLDQILVNLLSNAAKYGAGKPILVSVQAAREDVTVTVRDSGIGIAPEDLSRIFGKFERAVSHENFGGLGLGLFISRQLAEAMGATLSVASTLGEGSSFILQLRTAPPVRVGPAE